MSNENPDRSSDETDEELLEIEKQAGRLNSRDQWDTTIKAVEDFLKNDEGVSLVKTSLDTQDDKNSDGKDNNGDPPSKTPDSTTLQPTPETSSTNKPSAMRKSTEESDTKDEELGNTDTAAGQTTTQAGSEIRTSQSKKKVRFNDADEAIVATDDMSTTDSQEIEYVRSPKSYRLLKDIKIDLSKLIPASTRFGRRDGGQTQPSPSSSPELSFPGPSFSGSSRPGPSFEDLAAIPGPSHEDPFSSRFSSSGRQCIPFFGKNIKPHRRQFNTSSDDDDSSEGPYLEPTESHCLFEGKNLNLPGNISDPFEWDFADSPIKSLAVSENKTPTEYKLKLNDNDMPHIYDPKTNLYIPLKNGDKIEVVADVHPVPKQFCLVPENIATTSDKPGPEQKPLDLSVKDKAKNRKQPAEDTDRIDVVPNEDDDEGSLIFQLHDEDFDESMAPDNPDWSESPSPTFPERRHSI